MKSTREKSSGKPKMTLYLSFFFFFFIIISPPTELVAQLLPESYHSTLYGNRQHPLLGYSGLLLFYFFNCLVSLVQGLFYYSVRKIIKDLNHLGKAQLVCKSFVNRKYLFNIFRY